MKENNIKDVAINTFYSQNKKIINIKRNDYINHLIEKGLITKPEKGYEATEIALKNGYFVKDVKLIFDVHKLECHIEDTLFITQKGQNYILDYFKEVNSNEQ